MASVWMPHGLRRLRTRRGARATAIRPAQCGSAAAFARSIAARHVARSSAMPGLEQVARGRPGAALFVVRNLHLHVAAAPPALSLRLEPLRRAQADAASMRPWQPSAPPRAPAPSEPSAHTRMLVRIIAREHRVHSVVAARELVREAIAAPRPAVPAPPLPAVPPVEMVARRAQTASAPPVSTAPRSMPESSPSVPLRARPAQDGFARSGAVNAPLPLSPSEIGRLTDHVVRAIDRRVLAERERRGRA